jgi:transposase
MVLSAGVAAEIGDPATQRPVNNLVSYAGIIPRVSQSGGPDAETHVGLVARRCNRILTERSETHIRHLFTLIFPVLLAYICIRGR